MNPVAIAQLLAAVVTMAVSVPLIQRRVRRNRWYGVRIRAAFEPDEAWFDINRYGGRLLLVWGNVLAATGIVGGFLGEKDWISYDWTALGITVGGLAGVVALIYRFAWRSDRP